MADGHPDPAQTASTHSPGGAAAQQFATDAAALVDLHACQLEAWHGRTASWVLPACRPLRNLEITAGVGFVPERGSQVAEYVLQVKALLREAPPGRPGLGVAAGFGLDPQAQATGGGVSGVYAHVPASFVLGADRLVLHRNLGWRFERDGHGDHRHVHPDAPHEDEGAHHALTWAARSDLLLPVPGERFTLIAELFGEMASRPEYQVGVRTGVIPARLLVDISCGGHTVPALSAGPGAGWVVGVAWTPPPFR